MIRLLLISIALLLHALPSQADITAIVGATVHTVGPQGTLENATILIDGERIAAVGTSLDVPEGATIVDAAGKIVTPGLFSPVGRLGLVEVGFSAGPIDSTQANLEFTAGFDIADAYNPRSTLIPVQRIEGITRAAILPSPGGPDELGNVGHILSGLGAIVNLGDARPLDKRAAAMVVTLGESGSQFAAASRAGAWLVLRNALAEARDYRDNKDDFARGMRREYKHSMADLEALQGVIAGDIPLLVSVDRASDIAVLIDLVRSNDLNAIVVGGAEAWMLADELAATDIGVITLVTQNLPGDFDRINARRGAANILAEAGVRFALTDGQSQSHNARNITQSAGNAVADGLDWQAALRAITLAPAELYGVADNVGSIEVGKAADVVIWPADPFELTNYAEKVFINGIEVPMHSRQTLLRDRYLKPDSKTPPAWRK